MDFWNKLKKEKILLSVMMMAIVDLLILAVFIVFPIMDYNFKSKETSKSTEENLASNSESELEQVEDISENKENNFYDGPISDKYNSQGVEGYNANTGNGGEAAKDKDTSSVSTEDEEEIIIDDTQVTTTEEQEDNSVDNSSEQTSGDSDIDISEENQGTEESTTEGTSLDVSETSTESSEQTDISEEAIQ